MRTRANKSRFVPGVLLGLLLPLALGGVARFVLPQLLQHPVPSSSGLRGCRAASAAGRSRPA